MRRCSSAYGDTGDFGDAAVERLEVATPLFKPFMIPITLIVLFGLFYVQKRGTAAIGALFGPVMLVWFATLAILGVANIIQAPGVLVESMLLMPFAGRS